MEFNMELKDMDALLKLSGANLDFLLLLEEYLATREASLNSLLDWIKDNENHAYMQDL